jgi:hypothetical protein
MPWWGWLLVGLGAGVVAGGAVGYSTALFQIGRGWPG